MDNELKAYDNAVKQQNSAFNEQKSFVGQPAVANDPFVQQVNAGNFTNIVNVTIQGNKVPAKKPITTEQAIKDVNAAFVNYGMNDATEFMTNIAAAESNLGRDTLGDHSFSAFQIDPIRAYDIINRATENPGSHGHKRYEMANQYLQNYYNDPNFDLSSYLDIDSSQTPMVYNSNANLKGHDPMVGAVLTRLALAQDPNALPGSLDEQAKYYSDNWNKGGRKDADVFFKDQVMHHFPNQYTVNP